LVFSIDGLLLSSPSGATRSPFAAREPARRAAAIGPRRERTGQTVRIVARTVCPTALRGDRRVRGRRRRRRRDGGGLGRAQLELAVARLDDDGLALAYRALHDLLRQRILQPLLDHALQRTRAIGRVIP